MPYYPYFSFVQTPLQNIGGTEHRKLLDQAVTVPSPATDAIGEAASKAGMVVSIGVNERDGETLYNTQLLFDADGTLIQRRRKITPDISRTHDLGPGRRLGPARRRQQGRPHRPAGVLGAQQPVGSLCMMADGEQIHSAMYPGSIFGDLFAAADGNQYPPARTGIRRASSSTPRPGWMPISKHRS